MSTTKLPQLYYLFLHYVTNLTISTNEDQNNFFSQ